MLAWNRGAISRFAVANVSQKPAVTRVMGEGTFPHQFLIFVISNKPSLYNYTEHFHPNKHLKTKKPKKQQLADRNKPFSNWNKVKTKSNRAFATYKKPLSPKLYDFRNYWNRSRVSILHSFHRGLQKSLQVSNSLPCGQSALVCSSRTYRQ